MPNWVYNSLTISGPAEQISALKQQLNTPFTKTHENWNGETKQMEFKEYKYTTPVFAFHNIYNHIQDGVSDEVYQSQPDHSKNPLDFSGNDWYNWNVRNWGTKWDVAVMDDEKYPDTELMEENENSLAYRFNTAWSPPTEIIAVLSARYPNLEMSLSFEEETGWGGEIEFEEGHPIDVSSYDNKCRDCESINTLEYCENDCGEICSDCNYMGEADLDCVAECDTHKVYLDEDHIPEYRRETSV